MKKKLSNRKLALPGLLLPVFVLACALTNYAIPGQESFFEYENNPVQVTSQPNLPTVEQMQPATEEVDGSQEAYVLGTELRNSREYALAIIQFDQAIEINPLFYEAYYQRGSTKLDLEEIEGAMGDFNLAIAIDPGRAEAYNGRGVAYTKSERFEEAFNELDLAIKLKPDFSEAYNNRGIVFVKLGEISTAIDDFNRAIEFQPDNAEAFYNRGLARLNLGLADLALEDFQIVLSISDDPELLQSARDSIEEINDGQ